MLYPAYLLTQVSLLAGRQLSSEAEAGWPRLKEVTHQDDEPQETPSEADTPIQRILSEVTSLPLPEIAGSVVSPPGLLVRFRERTFDEETEVDQQQVTGKGQLTTPSVLGMAQQHSDSEEAISQTRTDDGRYVIQGVASLLGTRSLVLVTVENQILDILTPNQQQKLASKISWEVANWLRQRRLGQFQNSTRRLSGLNQPRVFRPLRTFWKVMAWVQTSPVAIAANLFQESTLIEGETSSADQLLPPRRASQQRRQLPGSNDEVIVNQVVPPRAIAFLDRAIAELESHQMVPGTEALVRLRDSLQDKWSSFPLANASRANLTQRDDPQNLRQQPQMPVSPSGDQVPATEASQTHPFQIQALIHAAIEYFFGRRSDNLSGTDSQEPTQIQGNPQGKAQQISGRRSPSLSPSRPFKKSQLSDAGDPDPWLSWDDLYGNSASSEDISHNRAISQGRESQISNPKSPAELPEAFGSKIPVKPRNSIWQGLKSFVSPKQAPDELSAPKPKKPTVKRFLPYTRKGELITTEEAQPLATRTEDKGSTLTQPSETPSSVAVAFQPQESVLPATTESTAKGSADTQSAITTPSTASQNTDLEPAPDWIETRVTPTGYVKHPLEQLLEWLDRTMVRVEDLALKVWRWLRHLGR